MVHSSESQNVTPCDPHTHGEQNTVSSKIESARSRLAELRGDNLDPGRFDSVKSALDMIEEMSALCARFPYGQDEAQQLCQRLIDSLIRGSPLAVSVAREGESHKQAHKSKSPSPDPPSYTNMDAFDSIVASRMLFELWAKWSRTVWLSQEKHIWEQVQRLSRICVPRDQWEEQFRSDTNALNNTIPVPSLDNSEIFKLRGLDPLLFGSDANQHEIAKICLDQMDGLVASFPFAKDTMSSVVARLRINFSGSCTAKFVERERVLQRRFEAELDHRRKIDKAWSELDEMEKWIDSAFPLGKREAHRCCTRLKFGISKEEKREIFQLPSTSRKTDTFGYVSKGHGLFFEWILEHRLEWIRNEHNIRLNLLSLGVTKARPGHLRLEWIEDVVQCAEEFLNDQVSPEAPDGEETFFLIHSICPSPRAARWGFFYRNEEAFNKGKKKAADSLRSLASPDIPDDLRERIQTTAEVVWPVYDAVKATPKKMQSPFKTTVSWVTEAHNQFLKWNRWDKFDWAVEEHTVWSEIHRLGSRGGNWTGKQLLSDTWANQIMDFLEKWMPCQDLTSAQKQRIAYSLRRLSNRYQISTQTSNRLVSAAIILGDSSELPLELIINHKKLEGGAIVCNPPRTGGSSDVRIGYYRFHQKREQVAIKEFRFLMKPYGETKPRFTLEAFTWAQLSKGDPPFVVKFFGAAISTQSLRLISQWQINDDIVHFLNLDENSHEDFRCQKICQVAHAISWLHSKDVVHADIKGANILVDAKGVPKLADFGISRIIHETIDESQEAIQNPSNSEPQSLLGVMKPWDADGKKLNADSAPIAKAGSTGMGFAGSINWMAPERFRSPHQPTKASDVYAFAFLVVEIFANGAPFSNCANKTVMEILHGKYSSMASQSADNPDLQDLRPDSLTSVELWNIMVGCMRYQPSSRLTAKDVHTEMKALCGRLRE